MKLIETKQVFLIRTSCYSDAYNIGVTETEEEAKDIIKLAKAFYNLIKDDWEASYTSEKRKQLLEHLGYNLPEIFVENIDSFINNWVIEASSIVKLES